MSARIDTSRLEALSSVTIQEGNHETRDSGMCAMEAVAWLAGENHTDFPSCACPVISAYVRDLNDDWTDVDRQRLKQYLPRLVGSVGSPRLEEKRRWLVRDWTLRVALPLWLDGAWLHQHASALRNFPPLTNYEQVGSFIDPLTDAVAVADDFLKPMLGSERLHEATTAARRACTTTGGMNAAYSAGWNPAVHNSTFWKLDDVVRQAVRSISAAVLCVWTEEAQYDLDYVHLNTVARRSQVACLGLLDALLSMTEDA